MNASTSTAALVSGLMASQRAKAEQLLSVSAPAGVYRFEFSGQTRQDIWDGTEFIGCTCNGANGDPQCDMFGCWGRAPGK